MASVLKRTQCLCVLGLTVLLLPLARPAYAIQLPSCGDGVVQPSAGEQCDDANNPCCDPATCRFKAQGVSCDGSSACAQFVCNGQGSCQNLARTDGTVCDDGNPCTTADQCLQGFCSGGPARDCEDGNVCTTDACNPAASDPAAACVHTPNQNPCDDGIFCNGDDVCAAGACTHDGDPCAAGAECNRSCDEASGSCLDPNGSACADDGNVCTDDVCDGEGTCQHPNNTVSCDDGVFCNGADVCAGGSCIHPGDPCTGGAPCGRTCNEAADNCLTPSGAVCPDDGNVCTDDTCDGQGNCTHPNNTGPCPDGVFCNGADTCTDGVCLHAGDPCANGAPCNGTCDEGAQGCHDTAGAACPDDGNPCTDEACDGAGTCVHTNNTSACDDGVFCNGRDTCQAGACAVHAGDPCASGTPCDRTCNENVANCLSPAGTTCADDGNVCTDDLCDGQGNCGHANNTGPCDDGQFCDGVDTCAGGVCVHAGNPCAGGGACNDTCDEAADTCQAPADSACTDDQNACTLDVCDAEGHCTHPAAPPSTMRLSVGDVSNTSDRFCVDVSLVNCGTSVSLIQGVVRAPSATFGLAAGSTTCGGLPAGFSCSANAVGDAIKFVVTPPVTSPPTCIAETGGQAVVHFCLQDKAPVCSGQQSVPLLLTDVQAVDCAGADASPSVQGGTVSCGGLLGDCDADGDIDADDVLAQVEVALQSGAPTAQQRERCDDDCDGDVDVFDMRDEMQAILAEANPPLPCTGESNSGSGGDKEHVAMGARSLRLVNRDATVRGVQITLVPTGGPVAVTGARATKRTKGFIVLYRQTDPNGPVRVLLLSPAGKAIRRGAGQIAKLSIARSKPRGKLHVTDVRIAK